MKQQQQKKFESTYGISDKTYTFDEKKQDILREKATWLKEPNYFKKIKVSALALLKMILHTTSASDSTMGNKLEVMGNLQGYLDEECFIITDSFPLPVQGTEVRVSSGNEALEFTGKYADLTEQMGRKENIIGWYHSHPGYGCWLSKIDIDTQMNNQKYMEPFVAIVVDPVRTVSQGKVEIGAFRVWPEGYKAPESHNSYISVPKDKIEDFGVHHNLYYSLEVEYFKSSSDTHLLNLLWNKYWMNTLSSSPLNVNKNYINGQIKDLSEKIENVEKEVGRNTSFSFMPEGKKKEETELSRLTKDAVKLSNEILRGVINQSVKDSLFNIK